MQRLLSVDEAKDVCQTVVSADRLSLPTSLGNSVMFKPRRFFSTFLTTTKLSRLIYISIMRK